MSWEHLKAMALKSLESHNFAMLTHQEWDRIAAVVEAAKDEAIMWNEELCNSKEYETMAAARGKLMAALKELGVE